MRDEDSRGPGVPARAHRTSVDVLGSRLRHRDQQQRRSRLANLDVGGLYELRRQRRMSGLGRVVLSRPPTGLTTRGISPHLGDIDDTSVGRGRRAGSRITRSWRRPSGRSRLARRLGRGAADVASRLHPTRPARTPPTKPREPPTSSRAPATGDHHETDRPLPPPRGTSILLRARERTRDGLSTECPSRVVTEQDQTRWTGVSLSMRSVTNDSGIVSGTT